MQEERSSNGCLTMGLMVLAMLPMVALRSLFKL